jgi:hypothetical protein
VHLTPARATRATHAPRRGAPRARGDRTLALALTVLLAVSCAGPAADERGQPAAATSDRVEHDASARATVDGSDVVIVTADGSRSVVASVEGAELLHAEVRPGDAEPLTVLALTRAEDRYELRYLTVLDGEASDLFWFPSRLQVSPDTVEIVDVPTLPVWAPDGSGLAWLEWDAAGTRLRTVGWFDHDLGTNPSDEAATYALTDLPVGTQLDRWEQAEDGTPVLVTRGEGDDRWRIRIEEGEPIIALEQLP